MVRVEVTKRDIKRGEKGCTDRCPIALATRRALGIRARGAVRAYAAFLRIKGWTRGYNTAKAAQFMYDFDHDRPVKPFTFRIRELE